MGLTRTTAAVLEPSASPVHSTEGPGATMMSMTEYDQALGIKLYLLSALLLLRKKRQFQGNAVSKGGPAENNETNRNLSFL
jgi:hypothetical protein